MIAPTGSIAASAWPQFRGFNSKGVADGDHLPLQWGESQNIAWKAQVPGVGWSSPIGWGNRIFVTSVLKEGELETPKKGLYFNGERPVPSKDLHIYKVFGFDLETGRKLWERDVHSGRPSSSVHLKNSYASETPVTDGTRVYAYFGNLGLFCLDMEGNGIWSKNFEVFPTRYGWGTAASPVLHNNRLYIVNDNDKQSFLVALDPSTGNEIWRVNRDEPSNWATPYIWENHERTEIVTPGRNKVRSYNLKGEPLWELGGMSSIAIPTPFSEFGLLYVSSGYVGDNIRPLFAIRPGASGDISLKEGETSNSHVAWYQAKGGPYNPSPLVYGDYLYVLYDRGLLSCYEAKTGRLVYDRERLNTEGVSAFTSSPWAYGGKLFCLSEDGDTFVVEAGPAYKLHRKNSLAEMSMATPAVLGDSLIIRTMNHLYCIRSKPL
ncbi:MAG: PQQ-binding-like beta-propeller repeat protein [Verrucomicrobia bacterium]|nr:PQQ-binding-like beta-propeller repeat protein [Verrucomicrobiota bacterium]